MLKITLLFSTLAILNVNGQSMRINDTLESWTARRLQETPPRFEETKPNEIKVGKLTYSGIAVEAIQLDNPLQLINPAAPVQYGFAEANLVRDPIVGRVSGLKIFSIQF